MNNFISRWLILPLWGQVVLLCIPVAVAVLPSWWFWSSPVLRQSVFLQAQHQQQARQYDQLIQRLLAAGSLTRIDNEIAQLRQTLRPESGKSFSLLGLANASGGKMAAWQPALQGGNLTLNLSWSQVHSVFSYFGSLQSGVELPHFTLKPEQARLRFQLILALNNED